jgi:hypothetical protein
MNSRTLFKLSIALLTLCFYLPWSNGFAQSELDSTKRLKTLFHQPGFHGGLIVHLGCDETRLTAALAHNGNFVVQGLENDPEQIRKAQDDLHSNNFYGTVTIKEFRDTQLLYIDNLINLLIVEDSFGIAKSEKLRVISPNGRLIVRRT